MRSRRVLVIAAGFVAIAGLAAGIGAAASTAPAKMANRSAEKVTLKVWDIFYFPKQKGAAGAQGKAELMIDQAFMKMYPNVTVEHVGVPGTDFSTDLRKFVASRTGPDVVTDGGGSYPQNAGFSKAMYPMYKLITPKLRAELGPYLTGEGIGDEMHYSIPNVAGVYAFLYNKALFGKAHISRPPVTFAELLADCGKLAKANILPITNGFTGLAAAELFWYGTSNQVLSPSALQAWAKLRLGWKDPRIVTALRYVQQMAERGCFGDRSTAATRTDTDGFSAFVGGRGAMLFQGGNVTSASFSKAVLKDIGVFPFPKVPTSVYPAGTPDSGYNGNWSIMNYTKVCRTAWNYIVFFAGAKAQAIQYDVAGLLPVNVTVKVKATNAIDQGLLKLAANKQGHHGVGATTPTNEADFLGKSLSQLINGTVSPEQLVDQVQAQRTAKPPASAKLPTPPPCVDGQSVAG